MTAEQKDEVLKTYHPDYIESQFEDLKIGPNKGDKVPHELAALLQANSRIDPSKIDLEHPKYDVDVLIIGGGGAGSSAAIEAHNGGANVMIVTKLRIGDANTMMAEGGIQAAVSTTSTLTAEVTSRASMSWFTSSLMKLPTLSSGSMSWALNSIRLPTEP